MSIEYRFRLELKGHEGDIKALAINKTGTAIVSCSRDATAKVWTVNENKNFELSKTLVGHTGFVNSVAILNRPTAECSSGAVFTGSQDKSIIAWDADSLEQVYTLKGHTGNVCALAADDVSGCLLSGSWDFTARIWRGKESVALLEGHQASVWTVAFVPESDDSAKLPTVLTGSADKLIFLWRDGQNVHTFKGHQDAVRSLLVLSSSEFISGSNDHKIRRWNLASGDLLQEINGHDNYIYSTSVIPDFGYASVGEDWTLKIWKDRETTPAQTLLLPAESTWCVVVLPNSDIVVGCGKCGSRPGTIRLFTKDVERMAPQAAMELYDLEVTAAMQAQNQPEVQSENDEIGGIKIKDLPGEEALKIPGAREGMTKMIRVGETMQVDIYSWSTVDGWQRLGTATGAAPPNAPGKKTYLGKEYDVILDVDADDNRPALKLPYNKSQDPWMAAQDFLWKNDLPQTYLDTVAKHIVDNVPGAGTGAPTPGDNLDPLTGGGRYVPGGSAMNGMDTSEGYDPFTGGNRYVPGSGSVPGAPRVQEVVFSDPLTGGGRYVPNGTAQSVMASSNIPINPIRPIGENLPLSNYKRIDTMAKVEILMKKVKELNGAMDKPLGEEELEDLESMAKNVTAVTERQLRSLEKALEWPQESIFPILDILRFVVLTANGSEYFLGENKMGPRVVPMLWGFLALASEQKDGKVQTGVVRAICNGLSVKSGREFLMKNTQPNQDIAIGMLCGCMESKMAAVQSGAAKALANWSLALIEGPSASSEKKIVFVKSLRNGIENALSTETGIPDFGKVNNEALEIVLQATATALWNDEAVIMAANRVKLGETVARMKDSVEGEGGKFIARSIEGMLHTKK